MATERRSPEADLRGLNGLRSETSDLPRSAFYGTHRVSQANVGW